MRRRPGLMVTIAIAAAIAAPVVASHGGVAAAATSARSEYQAALRAARSANVHYVSEATQDGVFLEVVGNTGTTSGSQVLVIQSGTTVETLGVILVGSTGYVRGNAIALQKIIGLTAAQSTAFTNTWLSFPATETHLADLVGGLRNSDVATELTMDGPYSFGATKKIAGHAVRGIKGSAHEASGSTVPIELFVQTGGTPRPVEEVTGAAKGSTGIQGTVSFSRWGEKNHATAPTNSVPLASLASSAG
jgi:hypothetical protein